jgi:hypothetical protein
MADEATTPVVEEIATTTGSIADITETPSDESPKEETVPLRDLMRIKDDRDKLKARVKELEQVKEEPRVASQDIETLKAKYSDVSPDFIEDMATALKASAVKEAQAKFAPIESQMKQERFDKQFNALYEDQLAKAD